MLGNEHFYNRTIRKVVVAFGTVFNDILLVRYNKAGTHEYERTRVPLSFGAKEKYLTRITSDPTLTKSIATLVPRMSFDLVSLEYDSSRKFNTISRNFGQDSTGAIKSQYTPIPYNFEFEMAIYVRNTEDGTQILEQILPYFTPDYTVTVDFIPSIGRKYDMPIILNSVNSQVEYEGDMSTTRLIIWNLSFTAKGYIFPSVNTTKGLIQQANTAIYQDTRSTISQTVYVDSANGSGVFVTGEIVREQSKGKTGSVVYFANNSTGTLVVSDLTELFEENDVIIGDYSNAYYTINTVDLNPVKTVAVVTVPNPIDSSGNSAYGFTENITEFPQ